MCARGLGDPPLVVSDGTPGVIEALEPCFLRAARQRCLAQRMQDLRRRSDLLTFGEGAVAKRTQGLQHVTENGLLISDEVRSHRHAGAKRLPGGRQPVLL